MTLPSCTSCDSGLSTFLQHSTALCWFYVQWCFLPSPGVSFRCYFALAFPIHGVIILWGICILLHLALHSKKLKLLRKTLFGDLNCWAKRTTTMYFKKLNIKLNITRFWNKVHYLVIESIPCWTTQGLYRQSFLVERLNAKL